MVIHVLSFLYFLQAMLRHDIELPNNIPKLLMEKHANYLISYGTNKDEYVRTFFNFLTSRFFCMVIIMTKIYINIYILNSMPFHFSKIGIFLELLSD